ncbi:hypothetical protein [Marinobacter orientalis]|uniref:Uncharacterized protein n=1 Tax=Marinobacter orientalis TaxID=1928859 RepID=A0A7Y0RC22_9GAMM|nr:hypothetical protein [Marinobacter orientalis]NMT63480.1 hypothetical protein [Marinobacter orientalis]TGX48541.1 hypothetical protein DIT72_14200 [Marinobacter orientalis]
MIAEFPNQTAAQKPALTPLDDLLQNELQPNIGSCVKSGCLVLVPAQTGIGKTHSIKQLILEELVATGPDSGRTIYYITNSVDNVRQTYEELCELIDKQAIDGKPRFSSSQKAALKSQIVYLPSQGNQLLEVEEASVEQVIELFDLNSDAQLRHNWKTVKKLGQTINDHPTVRVGLQESLEREAAETYRQIISHIQARQRSENPVTLSARHYEILDKLIPGDRLRRKEARVCFMTTRKFLAGYQTTKNRIHPIRELNDALMLIDEFDRQNEIILQFMADQRAMDLIELTRTLHANLLQHRLERSNRYEGIEDKFGTLRSALSDFAERWNLQFAFNIDGASLENEKVRLFSDRTVTHAHSSEHIFKLVTDENLQKNIIRSEPRETKGERGSTQNRMSRFINEADWLFRRFIWIMRSSVWLYLNNLAKTDVDGGHSKSATLQNAVHSILRHFNLQDLRTVVFAAFDAQVSFSGRRSNTDFSDNRAASRTYHDNGLKLTDVRRNEGTLDTVSCYYTGFTVTPTGLLARLVESGAKIVGISATANSPTVTKNFDQDYLKTRLGSHFVELTHDQKARIGAYYQSRRRYAEAGVQVGIEFIAPDRNFLTEALTHNSRQAVRKPGAVLNQWLGKDGDGEFALTWVSRLLKSLDHFMAADTNRYMLVLLNRTISPAKHTDFISFLKEFLQKRSEMSGRGFKLFPGMDAQSMRLGEFENALKHLSTTNDKVIMLSTYASMGEGKNPDYPVELEQDRAELIWVGYGAEPSEARADIDTLYLEKPTHQLLSDSEDYQINQLLLFHQIMALQEAGWISPREARGWVKQALQGTSQHLHLGRYYETGDYEWLIRKVIEQAVGRTARTAFKRPAIKLFADSDLRPVLGTDPRSRDSLSHEYIALTEHANKAMQFKGDDRELIRLHNKAELYTADTLGLIRELMSGFHGADPETAIRNWEDLRKQLLTEPTRAKPSASNPRLYIQSPSIGGYRFSGNLETDEHYLESDRDLQFFDQAHGSRWISEAESGLLALMKNPIVCGHFESKGYATGWQQLSYIMNPAAFFNLYKGALGEEGIEALLQHHGLLVEKLPSEAYEMCDFLLRVTPDKPPVGIDAKHWRSDGTIENHPYKANELKTSIGMEHFAYINLFGEEGKRCRYLSEELKPSSRTDSSVLEVPGLLNPDTGEILHNNLQALLEWIGECQ